MRLTRFAKTFLTLVILSVLGIAAYTYRAQLFPARAAQASMVPARVELADAPASSSAYKEVAFVQPGHNAGCTRLPEVRMNLWAWNSQLGLMAANGGKQSTDGSLMCQSGVNLKLVREDDPTRMQENLIAFASALKKGETEPNTGVHFVAIMGDGAAQFLKGVNDVLETKLGSDYRARIIGSCGYSRGEDKFMGPADWKTNPQSSRGGVVAGYLRDGDWNIAQKWLGDNGLRNNPDERTWDPDALNWVAADSYVDAAKKYVEGWSEDRPVVRNGKPTGETKHITVQAVVTWTPGDVTVAREKGGIVSIVSTREYSAQMPNVIIGIDRWMKSHRQAVEQMLNAIFKGGEAVRGNEEALRFAASVSADVYGEESADYWQKYYRVVRERDRQGVEVELGGSYVNDLADNALLFGIVPGSADLLAATYTKFGDVVVQQYPELIASYPSIDSVRDASYVRALAEKNGVTSATAIATAVPTYETTGASQVVSRRAWSINFASGQAAFSSGAEQTLEELARELLVAGGASIEIHGHTDSLGAADRNQTLSEERAFAVKQWLMTRAAVNFPSERMTVFAHGATNPVAPNATEEGRARNRRVEIVLTTK